MPMGLRLGYNPYQNGMQPGMDGFVIPFTGAMQMTYGLGPLNMPPDGGVMPHDPYGIHNYMMSPYWGVMPHSSFGIQNYMMPIVPPLIRNDPYLVMSRDQFKAPKAYLGRKPLMK